MFSTFPSCSIACRALSQWNTWLRLLSLQILSLDSTEGAGIFPWVPVIFPLWNFILASHMNVWLLVDVSSACQVHVIVSLGHSGPYLLCQHFFVTLEQFQNTRHFIYICLCALKNEVQNKSCYSYLWHVNEVAGYSVILPKYQTDGHFNSHCVLWTLQFLLKTYKNIVLRLAVQLLPQ